MPIMANVGITASERARHARAELEAIVAALRLHELAELVAHGREILERAAERPESHFTPR
jgi:hypothetical protein